MAQIPLSSSFEGDFIVKLVMANSLDTMDRLAEMVAAHAVGRTVRPRAQGVLRVRRPGDTNPFPRWATLRNLGLSPMEAVEVYYEDVHGTAGDSDVTTSEREELGHA
ncbi:MAG TPA: toluene-4-monooxygenase system B family protein [Polyangia bacterium]